MPDHAMGWTPETLIENLARPYDPSLAFKDDCLKQCGDPEPIGRGAPTYPDRNEVRQLPRMEPGYESRMAAQEALIQALLQGFTGSLPCQADPECGERFSPPSDMPFGDILAEAHRDTSSIEPPGSP